jgi:multidrug efflux system membrane fusion protein
MPSDSEVVMERSRSVLFCFLGGLAVLIGCSAKPPTRSARVPVRVATVEARPMPFSLTSVGTVEAIQTAAVGSQVGGVVMRVAFREGDNVRAGQVLFELDPRPFRAAMDQALATLARDRAQSQTAWQDADRARDLYAQAMLSQAEYDQKRADAEALAATVRADSAAAAAARLNFDFATIRAPISGRTGRLMAHEGDYIKAATSDPLVTVIQPNPVRVRFTVPESYVPLVQKYRRGTPRVVVEPDSSDGQPLVGRLVFVDNAVDPVTGTLLLKGEFANRDDRLVPGQFVDVQLELFVSPNAIVIPATAVSTGQQGAYVYVVERDSTAALRPIRVDRTANEVVVVASGLHAGEMVVTDGQIRLSPGAKMIIRDSAAATP